VEHQKKKETCGEEPPTKGRETGGGGQKPKKNGRKVSARDIGDKKGKVAGHEKKREKKNWQH